MHIENNPNTTISPLRDRPCPEGIMPRLDTGARPLVTPIPAGSSVFVYTPFSNSPLNAPVAGGAMPRAKVLAPAAASIDPSAPILIATLFTEAAFV